MSTAGETLLSKSSEVRKVSEVPTSFQIDCIGDILDNCRSWQLRTVLIIYLTKIPTAFFMACIVYTAPVPHRVHIYCNETVDTPTVTSITHPSVISVNDKEFDLRYCDTFADIKDHADMHYGNDNYEMPWHPPNLTRSVIDVHNNNSNGIIPCDLFNLKNGKSVTTTYDIVCSRSGFVVVTQGMHLVGIIISGIVLRYSLKVVSPKNVMQTAMIVQVICGTFAGMVQSFGQHLTFRALAAIGCATAFGAGSVIFSDITRGRFKITTVILFDTFWSIGIIILSFITQYESRWTELYWIISYPTLVIVFLTRWLPDSPRWLLSHGDVEGTLNILVQAARKSNLVESLPTNLAFKLKTTQQVRQPPQTRWFKLWSESMFTSLRSLLLHVAFACFTIMFFGMVLNMPNYGRRHLTKSARFIAVSELIGCFIGLVFATKTKHKFLWSGLFNISGAVVAYCVWIWRHREAEFVDDGTLLYFCLILKASVSCSFGILSSCGADSMKLEKKPILMFSAILCGRIFLLSAPVIVSLGSFFGEYMPLTLFATIGAVGGLSMISIDFSS